MCSLPGVEGLHYRATGHVRVLPGQGFIGVRRVWEPLRRSRHVHGRSPPDCPETMLSKGVKQVLRGKWARGETAFGTMITSMRNPAAMLIMAEAGFDFVVLDCEHGSFSYETVEDMMLTSRGTGITPIVRIPEVRREPILKCLEAGAHGILAPQIEHRDQVEALVSYARYAPDGDRGVSLMRPHSGFQRKDYREYMSAANQRNLLIIQIESKRAIDNIDTLLSVPGVDCALVGPNDLSQSLTHGRHDSPDALSEAIHTVVLAAARHGIISGIHSSNLDDVVHWHAQGMRMCMWSTDVAMMMTQARQGLAQLQEAK